MTEILEGVQWFFENVAFVPLNALRKLELNSWFAANGLNWLFIIVGMVAFVYWMTQLKKFNENNEEDRDVMAHSFLGRRY